MREYSRFAQGARVATVCLAARGAGAASMSGEFVVDGIGVRTCQDLITATEADESRTAYASWAAGFLTGVNVLAADTFDITPWQSQSLVFLQLRSFCLDNLDTPLMQAL